MGDKTFTSKKTETILKQLFTGVPKVGITKNCSLNVQVINRKDKAKFELKLISPAANAIQDDLNLMLDLVVALEDFYALTYELVYKVTKNESTVVLKITFDKIKNKDQTKMA